MSFGVQARNANDDPVAFATGSMDIGGLVPIQEGMFDVSLLASIASHLSYWADEASALAWKNHPEHVAIRDRGRARWYTRYEVAVAEVQRDYRWNKG